MDYQVRTIREAEIEPWLQAIGRGFLFHFTDLTADLETRRPGIDIARTRAGFDSNLIVSTLRSFATKMTVPGGATVPTDAITAVTTTSTHRRRGLATEMVRQDLQAAADRGEQAAVLIAAEWGIYGRFGFGPATEHATFTLHAKAARLRTQPVGSVEFADKEVAREHAPAIYQRHQIQQPGELSWLDRNWDIDFGLIAYSGGDTKPRFHVLARDENGAPVGYASYSFNEKWERRQAAGSVDIDRLMGVDANAQALLWKHFIDHDLIARVVAGDRSPDDLMPWLLEDPRQSEVTARADFLWLRVIDTAALLSTRRYSIPGSLVLEVVDPGGFANGRYLIDADADGATCTPTRRNADLTLPATSLASIYLGGHRVRRLAAVGLLDEHTPGAVDRADVMFGSPVTPWSSSWF